MAEMLTLAVVFLASVIPPVIYLLWVRRAETCQRESFGSVLRAFIIGASLSIGIALVLETLVLQLLFGAGPLSPLNASDVTLVTFVSAVIVAPIVEELSKAIGVMGMRQYVNELEDGLVYGVSVGLGFAAAENMIYAGDAAINGIAAILGIAAIRAVSSTLLHASATASSGYGLGRQWLMARVGARGSWIGFYLLAVLLHAAYNFLAILGIIFTDSSEMASLIGLGGAVLLVVVCFLFIRSRIESLDRDGCRPPSSS
jgi:RsiW-degrading membrane proteinase PrsW (M82 family)